jgi:hypothetical protein
MARPLQKCVSLSGAVHALPWGPTHTHPDDYLKQDSAGRYPNRDYVKNSNMQYVRLWTDWAAMQPTASGSFQQTCDWLNSGDRVARMQALDAQIAAVNADKNAANGANIGAMLVTSGFPSWANGNRDAREVPTDRSTSGPWAWWITYLFLRYTGIYNPLGPGSNGSWQGNPYSARLDSLEICNEPNQTYTYLGKRGDQDPVGLACAIADMIMSADAMGNFWRAGGYRVPTFLAPGTSDVVQFNPNTFVENVLSRLNQANWRGAVPWFWTHHNYQDIKNGVTTRLTDVRSILARYPWSGQNRVIWLTEGGYDENQSTFGSSEPYQALLCGNSFQLVRDLSGVYMWTNHMLNEQLEQPFETAFFNDWIPAPNTGYGGTQGTQRSWGANWRTYTPS